MYLVYLVFCTSRYIFAPTSCTSTLCQFTNWCHPVELLTTYFPSHDTFATDRHGTGTGTAQQIRFAPGTAEKMRLTALLLLHQVQHRRFDLQIYLFCTRYNTAGLNQLCSLFFICVHHCAQEIRTSTSVSFCKKHIGHGQEHHNNLSGAAYDPFDLYCFCQKMSEN